MELRADKATAEAEALAFLKQEAGRVHAELRALVLDETYLGVKLEPAEVARHQRELLEELNALRALAKSTNQDFAEVLPRAEARAAQNSLHPNKTGRPDNKLQVERVLGRRLADGCGDRIADGHRSRIPAALTTMAIAA